MIAKQQCPLGFGNADTPHLSFVIPVYGSPASLAPLCKRIKAVCEAESRTYEIIMVDDRCPLGSWRALESLVQITPELIAVRLSRNFGQHAAIQAGLSLIRGEWVVVMDCDLQDLPEAVPALYAKASEGFDVVRARRSKRNDAWHRRLFSSIFYGLLGYLTGINQDSAIANFGIYKRKVIKVVTSWSEETKYFPAIIEWVGFSHATIDVMHGERYSGRSSYGFWRLLSLALNVVVGFSDKPLKLVMTAGLVIALFSFLISILVAVAFLSGVIFIQGWASVVLSLWFLAGSVLFALGLSGLYIGRILAEAKGRPSFIVDVTLTAGVNNMSRLREATDNSV